jgi:hypothetical protein
MINLEFVLVDGSTVMAYDVHPRSQPDGIPVPEGTARVIIWLGTR